jgi:hypothetical protein
MNPADLIPVPDAIPVPWGWFQILLTVTFVLHLVFMNAMLGGAIIAFAGGLRGRAGEATARDVSTKLPFSVAFAVNAGVAPLLFLQVLYGHFVYSSSILMGRWWLSIIGLLIVAYYAVYAYRDRFDRGAGVRQGLMGLAMVLLLFIGFLFTNNWTLAVSPERWTAYFDAPGGTLLNLSEPTLWPRYLHMVAGSVAVAGLLLALFARRRAARGDTASAPRVAEGMAWFSWATLLQVGLGSWWLMALDRDVMKLFMGGSPLASALLGIGLLLTAVALVFGFRRQVAPAAVTTVVLLLVMAVMREIVRAGDLAPYFRPGQLEVRPEVSPLILFLVVFVIGIGTVAHMLRLAARAGKEA